MKKLEQIANNHKNIAVITTGGGNDIFTGCAISKELVSYGCKVDLFGVLSPGANHTFAGKEECSINTLSDQMKRYVGADKTEISFDDTHIPMLLKELQIGVNNVYELSIKGGNKKLSFDFENFAQKQKYDKLVGIDLGGDILGRIGKDKNIISPLMDHSILHLLGESKIESTLLEFGLQTDGELTDIDGVISELKDNGSLIKEGYFDKNDISRNEFIKIHDYIINNQLRKGNTIPRTYKTFTTDESFSSEHKIYHRFGEKRRSTYRPVSLDKKHFNKYLLIDPKKLHVSTKTTTTKGFDTLIDYYTHLKNLSHEWKTEMDCLVDEYSNTLCLCISNNFTGNDREEIIQAGYQEFLDSNLKNVIVYSKDEHLINKDGCKVSQIGTSIKKISNLN